MQRGRERKKTKCYLKSRSRRRFSEGMRENSLQKLIAKKKELILVLKGAQKKSAKTKNDNQNRKENRRRKREAR
jgi:hypothetical protein